MRAAAVANVGEFYLPVTRGLGSAQSSAWREGSARVSSLAMLWGGEGSTVFLPLEAEGEHLGDLKRQLNIKDLRVVCLKWRGEALCEGILEDGAAADLFFRAVREGAAPICWGATAGWFELLKEGGLGACDSRELLFKSSWLGTKAGFRQFAAQKVLRMPQGRVYANPTLAVSGAVGFLERQIDVVAKADRGVGGKYQAIFSRSGRVSGESAIARALRPLEELGNGAVVVEELVKGESGRVESFSCQGEADGVGGFKITFAARHIPAGFPFEGALLGRGALGGLAGRSVAAAGLVAGRAASSVGFRGICGFDMALDRLGRPFLLEMNPRRTTNTHGAALAARLFGQGWRSRVAAAVAHDAPGAPDYKATKGELRDLLFPVGGERKGLIIAAPPRGGKASYLAFAGSAREALGIVLSAVRRFG